MALFFIVTSVLLVTSAIVFYNFISAPLLKKNSISKSPLISVLIPARNEEQNISQCLKHILQQRYDNYEIIVLDDESTDSTKNIVADISLKDNRIILISGKPLPEKWKGKNWACHQLAENANGDLFLFLDADVRISPDILSKAVSVLKLKDCSLLTLFPTQKIHSFGEFLIVPLMNWLLLSFIPIKLIYISKNVSFTAANGQFMLWKKIVYNEIGGHKAVSDKNVEDMELARAVKKKGYKILTCLGDDDAFCKMYSSFKEGFNGFTKNFFPGFNIHPILFFLMILFLFLIYTIPFLLLFFQTEFIISAALILIQRFFISIKSKQNFLFNILLHPVQMFIMLLTGINSLLSSFQNNIYWKGRKL